MYSIIFADGKKFIFTKEQIELIPYFNTLSTSTSFLEKDIINIKSSSIGFKYIHMYATMDEIDIIDPFDKYLFAIKQCDYFGYDKLKILLEEKYGYKTDITDVKEKVGIEITIKMKYLGKINITKRQKPILFYEYHAQYAHMNTIHINYTKINEDGKMQLSNQHSYPYSFSDKICSEYILYKYYNGIHYMKYIPNNSYSYGQEKYYPDQSKIREYNSSLYIINPVYEYPKYSTDDEINEIYKQRYKMKFNTYFVKMIQNIILVDKDDVICVKINDSYKLLSEILEYEYSNIEYIVVENAPKYKDKYLVKDINNNLEIFEI